MLLDGNRDLLGASGVSPVIVCSPIFTLATVPGGATTFS